MTDKSPQELPCWLLDACYRCGMPDEMKPEVQWVDDLEQAEVDRSPWVVVTDVESWAVIYCGGEKVADVDWGARAYTKATFTKVDGSFYTTEADNAGETFKGWKPVVDSLGIPITK